MASSIGTVQPRSLCSLQEPGRARLYESIHLAVLRPRGFYGIGDVAGDELPFNGLFQGFAKQAMMVKNRLGR